ncbi:MAG: hypothetical protein ABEL76_09640, partial [Bradymonadaceae bacterium]
MTTNDGTVHSATIGYPRIGRERELKYALEDYWSDDLDREELDSRCEAVREQ